MQLCVVYNVRLSHVLILALCYVVRGARGGRCSISLSLSSSSSSSSQCVEYRSIQSIQDEHDDKVH